MKLPAFLSGNRTILKDSTGLFLGNSVSIGLGMLSGVILARSLSMSVMGHYQLILSYLAISQVATLPGMNVILNKATAKGRDALHPPILKRSLISSCAFALVLLAVGTTMFFLRFHPDLGANLIVVGFFLPVMGLDKYDSVFMGKRLFALSRRISVYSALGSLILIGGAAYFTKSIVWVIAVLFLTRIVTVAVGLALAKRHLSGLPVDEEVRREYLQQGWHQTYFTVFGIFVNQIDKVILGTMNLQLLAVYYVGAILPSRIKDNIKVLFGVVVNHWAVLPKRENFGRIRRNWWKIAAIGAFLTTGICIGAPFLIPFFYGAMYREAVPVAQLLSLSLPLNLVSSFILNADIFQNKGKYFNIQSVVRQVGYLILLAVLAPRYGYFGIISAILAAECGSGLASIVYFWKELKRS